MPPSDPLIFVSALGCPKNIGPNPASSLSFWYPVQLAHRASRRVTSGWIITVIAGLVRGFLRDYDGYFLRN